MENMIQTTCSYKPFFVKQPQIFLWHIDFDDNDDEGNTYDSDLFLNDNLEFEDCLWN
jgi:hypothetical protein